MGQSCSTPSVYKHFYDILLLHGHEDIDSVISDGDETLFKSIMDTITLHSSKPLYDALFVMFIGSFLDAPNVDLFVLYCRYPFPEETIIRGLRHMLEHIVTTDIDDIDIDYAGATLNDYITMFVVLFNTYRQMSIKPGMISLYTALFLWTDSIYRTEYIRHMVLTDKNITDAILSHDYDFFLYNDYTENEVLLVMDLYSDTSRLIEIMDNYVDTETDENSPLVIHKFACKYMKMNVDKFICLHSFVHVDVIPEIYKLMIQLEITSKREQ